MDIQKLFFILCSFYCDHYILCGHIGFFNVENINFNSFFDKILILFLNLILNIYYDLRNKNKFYED